MKTLTGGCECGQIRYESGEPIAVWLCHCRDCQRLSSSAYSYSMAVPRPSFKMTGRGRPAAYRLDEDRQIDSLFCDRCGTWIYTETPLAPDAYMIRVSTLDDHKDMKPVCQVWTSSALPWAIVPGILTADGDPSPEQIAESMRLWREAHP